MPWSISAEERAAICANLSTLPPAEQSRAAAALQKLWCDPLDVWAKKYLPHYFTDAPSKMHLALAKLLDSYVETRGNKNAIIAPRGGAKTTWVSKTFPLHAICHRLEHYIILVGDTTEQAQQNLEAVKTELTDNEELAKAYPNACGIGPVWNQDQIVTRNGVKLQALGAGKAFRGRTFRQYRVGLVVVDDLDSDEAVMSEGQRVKMWNWFSKVLIPIGTKRTNFLVVGTALHCDDTMHRLKKNGSWQFHLFQGLLSEPKNLELWGQWQKILCNLTIPLKERQRLAREFYQDHEAEMLDGAEVLWPEREPLYFIMEYRAAYGESAFLSEYQGVPTASLSAEWPEAYFPANIWFDHWPDLKLKVISLDPSKGKTDTSDYSAYVLLGLGTDGLLYVDADLERRDTTRIVEDGLVLAQEFQPHLFIVEINQFQELLKGDFERGATERGMILSLAGVNNHLKKETRIRTLGSYIRNGRLRFKANSNGAKLLVDQLREFPFASHDDGPDSLAQGIEGLQHLLGMDAKAPVEEETWST